jgi:hypothetical protein
LLPPAAEGGLQAAGEHALEQGGLGREAAASP